MKLILIYAMTVLSAVPQSPDQQMSAALRLTRQTAEPLIENLISQGLNPSGVTDYGAPYLYVTVHDRMEGITAQLLDRGADVNAVDHETRQTPLFEAVSFYPDGKMVELLIQHGAKVNVKDVHGATPLHFAASVGYEKVIDILVKAGALVNARDDELRTPIMEAAGNGKIAAINKLIALGADVKLMDKLRLSALAHAAMDQQPEAIILLAKAGAPTDTPSMQGSLPLFFSCILNKRSTGVGGLVAAGADLKTLYQGYTPLGYAVGVAQDIPTVTAILSGKPDLNAFSHEGFVITGFSPLPRLPYHERTALMQAAESGQIEMLKLLLAAGADKTIKGNDDKTASDLAIERGHPEAADLLK